MKKLKKILKLTLVVFINIILLFLLRMITPSENENKIESKTNTIIINKNF